MSSIVFYPTLSYRHIQPAAVRGPSGPHASQGTMDMAQYICRGHQVTVSEDWRPYICRARFHLRLTETNNRQPQQTLGKAWPRMVPQPVSTTQLNFEATLGE